jgi:hypothetical protein
LKTKNIVILGQGALVGKPVLKLLELRGLYPAVLVNDSKNKEEILKNADVIISGIGKDDGSKPVIRTLNKYRYDTDKIFVCGVNICACVRATVKGLAKNYPNSTIEILQNACNCTCFTGKTTCVGSLRSSIGNYRNVCIR